MYIWQVINRSNGRDLFRVRGGQPFPTSSGSEYTCTKASSDRNVATRNVASGRLPLDFEPKGDVRLLKLFANLYMYDIIKFCAYLTKTVKLCLGHK